MIEIMRRVIAVIPKHLQMPTVTASQARQRSTGRTPTGRCSTRSLFCSLVDAREGPSLLAESFKEIGTDQMTRIGINGFGRIGRLVFRSIVEQGLLGKEVDVVALNDIVPADNLAYLLKYDSTQGRFQGEVRSKKSSSDLEADDMLVVNGHEIRCLAIKQGPAALPWGKLGCEIG